MDQHPPSTPSNAAPSAPSNTPPNAPLSAASLTPLLQALARQHNPVAALYVVATPIGNVCDISLRALSILQLADAVAAEDTRVAGGLLTRYGLHKPLLACDAHRESAAVEPVLARLAKGERVALVTDAGTPAVSDPGAHLVAAVRAAGYTVVPVPGASSVAAAVSASGLVAGSFTFFGFLPNKGAARTEVLQAITASPHAAVFFEAPHRIADCLAWLAQNESDRPLTIARELTKQFEEITTLPCADAPAWLTASAHRGKGEFVLILAPQEQGERNIHAGFQAKMAGDALLSRVLPFMPMKEAVKLVVDATGEPRNAVYEKALALRTQPDE
jgi:16S rRNA (cytidine1402-2'-O)-methyltransferase